MSCRAQSSRRHDPVAPWHGNNAVAGASPTTIEQSITTTRRRSVATRRQSPSLVDDVVPTNADPESNLEENWPDEVQTAIASTQTFAAENC